MKTDDDDYILIEGNLAEIEYWLRNNNSRDLRIHNDEIFRFKYIMGDDFVNEYGELVQCNCYLCKAENDLIFERQRNNTEWDKKRITRPIQIGEDVFI